jgi:hypothetical protein
MVVIFIYGLHGCAIAQAVSGWLPTAAAWVRAWTEHVRFVMSKVSLGPVFSEYFDFPCQSSFHQIVHHHNHPGLAQQAYWWLQCRVDPIGSTPHYSNLKNFNFFIYGFMRQGEDVHVA